MLIAGARGKLRRSRCRYEDEIVSAIFGPLLFASAADRTEFVRNLVSCCGISDSIRFDQSEISLWPNIQSTGRVEPDIVFKLFYEHHLEAVLLIEAKWNSPQHENQLAIQWAAAKNWYQTDKIWHAFLTQQLHTTDEMLQAGSANDHQGRLVNLTWRQVAVAAKRAKPMSAGMRTWSEYVGSFLSRNGNAAFVGFGGLKLGQCPNAPLRQIWHFARSLIDFHAVTSEPSHLVRWIVKQPPAWRFEYSVIRADRLVEKYRSIVEVLGPTPGFRMPWRFHRCGLIDASVLGQHCLQLLSNPRKNAWHFKGGDVT